MGTQFSFPRGLRRFVHLTPVALLALSAGCDANNLGEHHESASDAVVGSNMSKQRQDQAFSTSIVEGSPDLWTAGSCAGACGGPAPDRSCWCTNDCFKFGDCCKDFEKECLAGGTPGSGGSGGSKKNPKVTILNVMAHGPGCSVDPRTGKAGYSYQINGLPGVPNGSQFFAQMHSFELQSQSDKARGSCQLTAAIQWTPGHRVVIDHANIMDNMVLWKSEDGSAEVAFRANAGSGPGYRVAISRRSPFIGTFDEDFSDALNTHTSCAGVGYLTFTIDGKVEANNDEAEADLSHFNAGLRIAEPGETPDC